MPKPLKGAPGAALLAAALLLVLEAVHPCFFFQDDNRGYFLPLFVHDARALAHGELALFNFHRYLGLPQLALGQTGVLYPPVYLAVAASRVLFGHVFAAIDLYAILHLAAGAAGMFALLSELGLAEEACLFGALSWPLSGFCVLAASFWAVVPPVIAFFPWLLLCSRRVAATRGARNIAALAVLRALFFFSGYAEYFLEALLFEAAFLALEGFFSRAGFGRWLASLALFGASASPLALPLADAVAHSAYRGAAIPYALFSQDGIRPTTWLAGAFWPFGTPSSSDRSFFGTLLPHLTQIGWLGLAFVPWGLTRRRGVSARVLAAAALAWSFGWLDKVLYALPVFNRFRFHFKLLLFADFFLILLAARALSAWQKEKPSRRRRAALAAAFVQAMSLVAVAMRLGPQGLTRQNDPVPLQEPPIFLREGRIASVGYFDPDKTPFAQLMTFNYASLWRLDHFAGYDPLLPAVTASETLHLDAAALIEPELLSRPETLPELRRWGVRHYLVEASAKEAAWFLKKARMTLRREDADLLIFEDPLARPMAYWAASGLSDGIAAEFSANEVRIKTQNDVDDSLTINVLAQPGFEASLDGRPADVGFTIDHKFSLLVPAGRHELRLRYHEPAAVLGAALAACAWLFFWLWSHAA